MALVSFHMQRNVDWTRAGRDPEESKASPTTANPLLTGVCATRPSDRDTALSLCNLLSSLSLIAPYPPTMATEVNFFPSSLQWDFTSSPTSQTRVSQVFPSSAPSSCFSGLCSFCSSSFLECYIYIASSPGSVNVNSNRMMIAWCALQRTAPCGCLRVKLSFSRTQLLATTDSCPFSAPGRLLSGHYPFHVWAADIPA